MSNTHRISRRGWWFRLMFGDINHASHAEKVISGVGGFLGIFGVMVVSASMLDFTDAALIVASMGASAVLLFAVPHGALSQPWNALGGHLFSSIIGVTCAQTISDPFIAAPLAVGMAISVMYYTHCIHPPGGATALVAVIGGSSIHDLGYMYVWSPVMANALIITGVAVLVGLPFSWRRYPAAFASKDAQEKNVTDEKAMIAHSDLVYALSQLDSYIDVSEQDLVRIYNLALHHSHDMVLHSDTEQASDTDKVSAASRQWQNAESA